MNSRKLFILFAIFIFAIFLATSYSPELAIRRHLFFDSPTQSFTCTINKTNLIDKEYGQQYTIKGFIEPESRGEISFAYVKKSFIGMYHWSGGGSGP
ncbi:MAG TPA: hypothetical protein DCZ10_04830 [Pelotomaculum sp.]|mgnify:CR=1 FL=1|nr:hypothetical protein [Pelotomaculum sp.]